MRNYLRRMEREGVQRVKMFLVITAAYVIFWGPLFFVTLVHHPVIGNTTGYEVNINNITISIFHFSNKFTLYKINKFFFFCLTDYVTYCIYPCFRQSCLIPYASPWPSSGHLWRLLWLLWKLSTMDSGLSDK